MADSFSRIHLLGCRGEIGGLLEAPFSEDPNVCFRGWSGESGARSYDAFCEHWAGASDRPAESLVVIAGGRIRGALAELVDDHVVRAARFADLWQASGWPGRVVLIGSAAERLAGSPYGAVKRGQRLLLESALPEGSALMTLLVHSVVPEGLPRRGIFFDLLEQYVRPGTVHVHHRSGARDYLSARQLVTVVSALASCDGPWQSSGSTSIEVGNGFPVRVDDWLDAFRKAFGDEIDLVEREPETEDPEIVASTAALDDILERAGEGWADRYRLDVPALERCVARWRSQRR